MHTVWGDIPAIWVFAIYMVGVLTWYFVAGLLEIDWGDLALWPFVWPFLIPLVAIFGVLAGPYWCGEQIRNAIRRHRLAHDARLAKTE